MLENYYLKEAEYVYQEVAKRGLNSWSELFEPSTYEQFPGREFWKRLFNERPEIFQDSKVFEYGCGTGVLTALLARLAAHISASDVSATAIQIARKLRQEGNIDFKILDVTDRFEVESPYDVAVSNYMFQQILFEHQREQVLQNIYDLLQPGGFHILTTVLSDKPNDVVSRKTMLDDKQSFRLHRTLVGLQSELMYAGFNCQQTLVEDTHCCIILTKAK